MAKHEKDNAGKESDSRCNSVNTSQHDSDIIFVHTPKCKNCTPTADMLKRMGCAGCTKFNYYKK